MRRDDNFVDVFGNSVSVVAWSGVVLVAVVKIGVSRLMVAVATVVVVVVVVEESIGSLVMVVDGGSRCVSTDR